MSQVFEVHFDTLKEIANIGTGHAVTALSKMLQKNIRMQVPEVSFLEFKDIANFIGGPEALIIGVLATISGEMNGMVMFLSKQDTSKALINTLLGRETVLEANAPITFDEIELSAITEIGNIMVSSYLGSWAAMMNKTVVPSVPQVACDMANAVLSVPAIEFGKVADKALFIESKFITDNDEGADLTGYFVFVPEMESFQKMFNL